MACFWTDLIGVTQDCDEDPAYDTVTAVGFINFGQLFFGNTYNSNLCDGSDATTFTTVELISWSWWRLNSTVTSETGLVGCDDTFDPSSMDIMDGPHTALPAEPTAFYDGDGRWVITLDEGMAAEPFTQDLAGYATVLVDGTTEYKLFFYSDSE